ncbi:hypothetical protein HMPREF9141_1022 [Prevotella multiformis DSM 16608]|uniref:Uncharacterized protein n=1 Tax=Prevotella multiformis DSM 16608 TaxID=888743 RepID=F0F605_9BACT|nr:hypothetical protein HMPREF9141_1022 [Prevotella multiformis DSM 16608]
MIRRGTDYLPETLEETAENKKDHFLTRKTKQEMVFSIGLFQTVRGTGKRLHSSCILR